MTCHILIFTDVFILHDSVTNYITAFTYLQNFIFNYVGGISTNITSIFVSLFGYCHCLSKFMNFLKLDGSCKKNSIINSLKQITDIRQNKEHLRARSEFQDTGYRSSTHRYSYRCHITHSLRNHHDQQRNQVRESSQTRQHSIRITDVTHRSN